jgi:hypothetical protein
MKNITLVAKDKNLYYPDEVETEFGDKAPILLYQYSYPESESPDVDTIKWPNPNMEHLRGALFDDRECGLFGLEDNIFLPNGEKIQF